MNKKIYEIEFFINFYGSLNVVDWGKMKYGANDAGTWQRIFSEATRGFNEVYDVKLRLKILSEHRLNVDNSKNIYFFFHLKLRWNMKNMKSFVAFKNRSLNPIKAKFIIRQYL